MRLILVHGIDNQGKSADAIIDEWLGALRKTLPQSAYTAIAHAEIVAPYYGDALAEATKSAVGTGPIALATGQVSDDEATFYLQALEDIAPASGVTETDVRIAAGLGEVPIEQGLPHDRRLLALVRALEVVSPLHGALALRFLPQAFAYLHRAHVTQVVDEIVAPALSKPAIIVAHSLGTVVTYKMLRDAPGSIAPFYLTLGSPLAVKAVQNGLGPPFGRPSSVSRWLNGLDPNDAVTLGRGIKETNFGPGIENIDDIKNGDNPHDVRQYLSDPRITQAVARALDVG
jgi:hypothetical protein